MGKRCAPFTLFTALALPLRRWLSGWRYSGISPPPIPAALWWQTIADFPFLRQAFPADTQRLRNATALFLATKQFTGAQGLQITDAIAVAIAAQACLPVLHLPGGVRRWYAGFVTVVVHPGAMLAERSSLDTSGVQHRWNEAVLGEAMQGGPVTLSWAEVALAASHAEAGRNLVIHEFAHKIDMLGGTANGCPPLPSKAASTRWLAVMQPAYLGFCEAIAMAERFGEPHPWLDGYAATSPVEFFAVTCEAYFTNRARFAEDFAAVTVLYDGFFDRQG